MRQYGQRQSAGSYAPRYGSMCMTCNEIIAVTSVTAGRVSSAAKHVCYSNSRVKTTGRKSIWASLFA